MAELDKAFAQYHAKWRARLRVSDRQLSIGYMRGEALDAEGYATLPVDPSKPGIHVRVDGRGLDAQADVGALPNMLDEWRDVVVGQDISEARSMTKDFICNTIALNQHLEDDNGAMILSAALWLASDQPGMMDALTEPRSALVVEFVYDEETRTRTMKRRVVAVED